VKIRVSSRERDLDERAVVLIAQRSRVALHLARAHPQAHERDEQTLGCLGAKECAELRPSEHLRVLGENAPIEHGREQSRLHRVEHATGQGSGIVESRHEHVGIDNRQIHERMLGRALP
jgi:hypothetical protein